MDTVLIICLIIFLLALFIYNPTTNKIREINNIINKDRSVCDFINSLNGWAINNFEECGLRIVITPIGMPVYHLYITYNGQRPENDKIKELHYKLTNPNSPVRKAHEMNIPFEKYSIR